MMKMEIELDKERIESEQKYQAESIKNAVIWNFTKEGNIIYKEGDTPYSFIFCDSGTPKDYASLLGTTMLLSKQKWFIKYANKILWFNSANGDEVEDFLENFRKDGLI